MNRNPKNILAAEFTEYTAKTSISLSVLCGKDFGF